MPQHVQAFVIIKWLVNRVDGWRWIDQIKLLSVVVVVVMVSFLWEKSIATLCNLILYRMHPGRRNFKIKETKHRAISGTLGKSCEIFLYAKLTLRNLKWNSLLLFSSSYLFLHEFGKFNFSVNFLIIIKTVIHITLY